MRILVCIKQVPASNRVEVDPVTGVLRRDGADAKMNPYDLFALECALRLRERVGGAVTVLSMGPGQAEAVIREAFSMGADEGFLLSDRAFAGADVLATSYALAAGASRIGYDLILCGKQTTDGDTAQVGPEMGETLGIPAIANVTALEPATADGNPRALRVKMDMGESVLTAEIALPCLVCVDKDFAMPRLPSYVRRRETASRPITVLTAADLGDADRSRFGLHGSPTQVRRIFPPDKTETRVRIDGTGAEVAAAIADTLTALKCL